jgi:RNA polymerase sigma factor (sigma-70 family)
VIADAPAPQTYQILRPYLFSVAYRMTGSASDAEDLVQDAWIRYLDAGQPRVESLRAYLTTIVSRLALDYLKSARVKREQYIGTWLPEPVLTSEAVDGPAEAAEQREQVSLAMLTLLEHLTPEQRVVYVLREGFGSSYEEIATHLDKTPAACRQIFRRARQRVEASGTPNLTPSPEHDVLIMRFMDAFAKGDAAGVASVLAEDVVWSSDGGPNRIANRNRIRGRNRVARGFAGFARKGTSVARFDADVVDIYGMRGVAIFYRGQLERVMAFETADDAITGVHVLINPEKLRHLAASLGTEPAWETPFPLPRRARGTI